jgi:hypothetical protein
MIEEDDDGADAFGTGDAPDGEARGENGGTSEVCLFFFFFPSSHCYGVTNFKFVTGG